MKIGLHNGDYGYAKVVYGDKPPPVTFVTVPSLTLWKLPQLPKYLQWVRVFSPYPKVELIHTYNHLVVNRRPWMVSFESFLPRFQGSLENRRAWIWGMEKLSSDWCRKILPISQAAKNALSVMGERNGFPRGKFDHKVEVVYPALDVSSFEKKEHFESEGPVRLLFVGNAFFRKGGRPLLRAFRSLSKHYDMELTVVSTLRRDFFTYSTESDRWAAVREMEEDERINWLEGIPFSELVTRYFPQSDIFILPTLQDSFGFVNIEAMACGLPVISTRQFAIPEQIHHGENGFLIDLPVDELGRLDCISEPDLDQRKKRIEEVEEAIAEQLKRQIVELVEDPKRRKEMGGRGRQIAESKFDVAVRNESIMRIYGE